MNAAAERDRRTIGRQQSRQRNAARAAIESAVVDAATLLAIDEVCELFRSALTAVEGER